MLKGCFSVDIWKLLKKLSSVDRLNYKGSFLSEIGHTSYIGHVFCWSVYSVCEQ